MSNYLSKRKPYQQPLPNNWWLKNSAYRQYMARSATCFFVILYALNLFWALTALIAGEEVFNAWLVNQQAPFYVVFHVIGLIAMLYHSQTWFMLAPKTIYVQLGKVKVSDKKIEVIMWLVWCVVTFVVFVILLK